MSATETETLKEKLQRVDPYEFEDLVGALWEKEGWQTTVSQGSNDMGVDVIAEKDGTIGQKLVIQAKRYSEGNKVGRPKIQQYHSLKEQDTDADAAVVVTTSSFTKDARLWAMDHNVKLVDGDDLVQMVRKHDAEALVEAYVPEEGQKTESSTSSSSSSSSASSTSTSSTSGSGIPWFGLVFVSACAQFIGMLHAVDPSASAALSANDATLLFGFAWMACGPLVFMDAHALHKAGKAAPNRVIAPMAVWVVPLLGVWYYIYKRF